MGRVRLYLAATSILPIFLGGAFVLTPRTGQAQHPGGLAALERRVTALEAAVTSLQRQNDEQAQEIAGMKTDLIAERLARIQGDANTLAAANVYTDQAAGQIQGVLAAVADKVVHFCRIGNDVYIAGANLHVVNGLPREGRTDITNGLGNLIVGYNEDPSDYQDEVPLELQDCIGPLRLGRDGSHNLVIGRGHSYQSFGGLVAGEENAVLGASGFVAGQRNVVDVGGYGSVVGGRFNRVHGRLATICGGEGNLATGYVGAVLGGRCNEARGYLSTVSAGSQNLAIGVGATVGGGLHNSALGLLSSISGGRDLDQGADYGWRAGALLRWPP